ncbi:MAG TPA: tetratricopeptide repeat protein [Hyphomicrobiales bacterium]|nr:tetratricopeptide repeat protein [Hyphomicrobiales bacterium]
MPTRSRHGLSRAALLCGALLVLGAAPALANMPNDNSDQSSCSDHSNKKNCGQLVAVKALIDQGDFAAAFKALDAMRAAEPESATVLTAIGYAYRKQKDYPTAMRYYDAALARDPNSLATLEYQGEWYVERGDMARARANLVKLARLCGECEERDDLAQAIDGAH